MSLYTIYLRIGCSIYITCEYKVKLTGQIVAGDGREEKNCLWGMKKPSVREET